MQNRARSEGIPLCVAVLDLDHFKKFNDTFGHQAGDNLLMATATAWQERLGQAQATAGPGHQALLGRWGGEEFVLLLMGHDQQDAVRLVEALAPATPAGQSFSRVWPAGTGWSRQPTCSPARTRPCTPPRPPAVPGVRCRVPERLGRRLNRLTSGLRSGGEDLHPAAPVLLGPVQRRVGVVDQ